MKMNEERGDSLRIEHYESGLMVIAGERFTSPVLINNRAVRALDEQTMATLQIDTLLLQLDEPPELVLFGSGARFSLAEPRWQAALGQRGIGCESMDSAAACRTFNLLIGENRRVAALILPP